MEKMVACAQCGTQLGIPDDAAGHFIECPSCGATFIAPKEAKLHVAISPEAPVASTREDEQQKPRRRRSAGAAYRMDRSRGAGAVAWVLIAIIMLILIGGAVLAAWFIILEEKDNRILQAAVEAPPNPPEDPPPPPKEPTPAPIEVAQKEKDVKNELPPAPVPPATKIEPVKEVAKKESEPAAAIPPLPDTPRAGPKDEVGIGWDGWFEVNSLRGKFTMLVPGLPTYRRVELADVPEAGDEYQAAHFADGAIFRGSSIVAPHPADEGADSMPRHLKGLIARLLPKPAFELKRDQEVKQDGHAGREFVVEGLGGVKAIGWYFRVPDSGGAVRVYCFSVAGPGVNFSAPDVKRFFQSVKIDFPGAPASTAEPRTQRQKPAPPPETSAPVPKNESTANESKTTPEAKTGLEKKAVEPTPEPMNQGRAALTITPAPGKLSPHVGAVIDVQAKSAVLFLPGALAQLYNYPEFQPLASYKLVAGTAHHPIYQPRSARLFTLAASAKAKDPAGKPGGSQLALYDFRNLVDGKLTKNAELAPQNLIALPAYCSQLCVSADGAWAYLLEPGKTIRAIKVKTATGELAGSVGLPDFTTSIALAKDGKRLYALSHLTARTPNMPPPRGAVLVIDPETMNLQQTVSLTLDPFQMEPAEGSLVFISAYGGVRGEILVVDAAKEMPLVTTWKGVPPSVGLKLTEDAGTMFIVNGKSNPVTIGMFEVPRMLAGSDLPSGAWVPVPAAGGRTEVVVTPDNRYLLGDSGVVFHLR